MFNCIKVVKEERGRGGIKTARGEKLQSFAIKTFLSPVSNLNVVRNRNTV